MSEKEIVMFINEIDAQLKKNKEIVNISDGNDVNILSMLSQNLIDTKRAYVDILLCEYGVFYTGKRM